MLIFNRIGFVMVFVVVFCPLLPTFAQDDCWIAYHTNQTGAEIYDWEIFAWGSLPANLDPNLSQGMGENVFDLAPSRAPDGSGIVFTSTRDGNWEIYRATLDGQPPERLTVNETAIDIDPVYSPDGTKIVYDSNVDGNWELHVLDLEKQENIRLTDYPANDLNASWSPDGTHLLFQTDRDEQWQIYRLDLETLAVTRLSDGLGADFDPVYSNDGTQIAFRSVRDDPTGENSTVQIMNADGSNLRYVSEIGDHALNYVWSADDSLLAYQADQMADRIFDIYIFEVGTGQTRQLTANTGQYATISDTSPTWYCETDTLVFTSEVLGNPDLFTAPALPIEAPPISVDQTATQITFTPFIERDAVGFPNEENASRQEALPPPFRSN